MGVGKKKHDECWRRTRWHAAPLLACLNCLLALSCLPLFQDQLQACIGLYVEDQMERRFRFMIEFVKKAEQQQKRQAVPEGQPIPHFGPAQV